MMMWSIIKNVMLPIVSNALNEFNNAMTELGMQDNVVTFTMSDFARTLTSNGNGSDHAWGGNSMIMGGPIKGVIYLVIIHHWVLLLSLIFPVGAYLPTTSVDEFIQKLLCGLGYLPMICRTFCPISAILFTQCMPGTGAQWLHAHWNVFIIKVGRKNETNNNRVEYIDCLSIAGSSLVGTPGQITWQVYRGWVFWWWDNQNAYLADYPYHPYDTKIMYNTKSEVNYDNYGGAAIRGFEGF